MISPNALLWKDVINSEIELIMHNHAWEIVDLPPSTKTIGCKWILRRKQKPDAYVEKYKTRLVVKGFKQKKIGVYYFDTFVTPQIPRVH